MTGVDVEHTKALKERAQLGHLVAVTSGVRNGDHWYICDDNESVATIAANDGIDEELRQPRAELFAHAVNTLPALVAAVERVQALHEPLKLFLLDDNGSIDYSKPFDTLCRGCTDPDIVNAWECDDGDPGDDYVQHPCPTIEALEAP